MEKNAFSLILYLEALIIFKHENFNVSFM